MAWIETRAVEVASAAMLFMVFSVTFDVLLRYAFNAPLTWSYELVSMYLLPAIAFLPLATVQRQAHHVNVDLFFRMFRPGLQRIASALSALCGAAVIGIAGLLAAKRAWDSFAADEVVSGPVPWPVWVGPALLAVGAILFVLRSLAQVAGVLRDEWQPPGSPDSERIEPGEA